MSSRPRSRECNVNRRREFAVFEVSWLAARARRRHPRDDLYVAFMKRILIVEDNEDLAGLFTMALDHVNYVIQTLHSAEGIVDEVERFGPDLILMDLRMPGVSGVEAAQELRKHDTTRATRIILISANARVGEIARALGVPYLAKPFDLAEFRGVVAAALERAGSQHDREMHIGGRLPG